MHSYTRGPGYCHVFFPWYKTEHRHTGLALLTPHDVHYGLAEQHMAERAAVLATASTLPIWGSGT